MPLAIPGPETIDPVFTTPCTVAALKGIVVAPIPYPATSTSTVPLPKLNADFSSTPKL